ncbi:MAG: helix-turn-helix domain-containing protein [Blastocatellia bacterium]
MRSLPTVQLRISLKAYLASIDVTPYMLGKWVIGVSPQTIFAIANGTRKPSLEVLQAIINGLRVKGYPTVLGDIVQIDEAGLKAEDKSPSRTKSTKELTE